MSPPSIILIAGPSGSGKSTFAKGLAIHLESIGKSTTVIALDNYYRDLRHLTPAQRKQHNFDEPNAWEHERILRDARKLKAGETVDIPVYDFSTHLRSERTTQIQPTDAIILEGLFALCYPELNALANLKIYVELEDAIALERRISRDTAERGRSRESVIEQYQTTVQPANARYIHPSAKHATLTVQGTAALAQQIESLSQHLQHL